MAMMHRTAGLKHHQEHTGVLALSGRFPVTDNYPAGEADQPILMMGDIGQDSAGLGQTLRTPA